MCSATMAWGTVLMKTRGSGTRWAKAASVVPNTPTTTVQACCLRVSRVRNNRRWFGTAWRLEQMGTEGR